MKLQMHALHIKIISVNGNATGNVVNTVVVKSNETGNGTNVSISSSKIK